MTIKYYKKCNSSFTSIVDALKSINVDASLQNRKKIGALNNISKVGTEQANRKMLNLLKKGKLIKSIQKTNGEKYVDYMNKIHEGMKKYGNNFFYSFTKSEKTFDKAIKKAKEGKKTGTTCVVPTRWGLEMFGIDPSGFYGKQGKFSKYSTTMKKYLNKITDGTVINLTIKQAKDKGLLQPGDIITFKGKTHTVSYTGDGYNVFDGGSAAEKRGYAKVGIILNYAVVDKNYKISEIMRWK